MAFQSRNTGSPVNILEVQMDDGIPFDLPASSVIARPVIKLVGVETQLGYKRHHLGQLKRHQS